MDEKKNYQKMRKFSLLYYHYCFVDSHRNLADQLFVNHEVRVYFGAEFEKKDYPYKLICCKIRKANEKEFLAALSEMYDKMYLMGYTDYAEECVRMDGMLNGGKSPKKQGK